MVSLETVVRGLRMRAARIVAQGGRRARAWGQELTGVRDQAARANTEQ
jgi:hypothetical protein